MSSIDENEADDELANVDEYNSAKNDFYGLEDNGYIQNRRKINMCKDDLTNEMVQEATLITNIVKETIRGKQMQKQQQQNMKASTSTTTTPMKTPGKKKTPSKFKVFEDETNTSMDRNEGNSALKSRQRTVLRPKSDNTPQQPLTDKKKKSGLLMMKNSNIMQNSQVEKASNASVVKTKSPKTNVSSSAARPSLTKKIQTPGSKKKRRNKQQEAVEDTDRHSPKSPNKIAETNVTEKVSTKAKDPTKEEVVACEEKLGGTIIEKGSIDHNSLVREEGELLSTGSQNVCERTFSDTVQYNDTNNDDCDKKSISNEEDDDDANTCTSSLNTPTSSVQTFSIGGRSYSFDVSANALRSMFTAPLKQNDSNNLVNQNDDLSNNESITGDTIYQDISMRTENILNDSVSPTSKILASSSKLDISPIATGISRSSAASLIERNKTLIKEVRFADQTCVELSERNAAIQRDVTRMDSQIGEMKKDNQLLHEEVVRSKEDCAKLVENKVSLTKQLDEQRGYYEAQIRVLQQALKESKDHNEMLTSKFDESTTLKQSTEKELVSTQAKFEALQESHDEAKEKISSLMARLATSQSTAEVSAASAAQSYREFCVQMEKKVERLERISEERLEMYNKEKDEKIQIENEHSNMIRKCAEMEKLIENWEIRNNLVTKESTPSKAADGAKSSLNKEHNKTPTSSVLARTLEAELQRGHDATERILEAEMIISVTQSELQESTKQLNEAKMEIVRLNNHIHELTEQNMQHAATTVDEGTEPSVQIEDIHSRTPSCDNSSLETLSTDELIGKVLSQKLTHARSECEDYKRELEKILNEIKRVQGESFNSSSTNSQDGSNEQTVSGLLHAVRELAQVCAKQADEINCLKTKSEERKCQLEDCDGIIEEKNQRIEDQDEKIEDLKQKL